MVILLYVGVLHILSPFSATGVRSKSVLSLFCSLHSKITAGSEVKSEKLASCYEAMRQSRWVPTPDEKASINFLLRTALRTSDVHMEAPSERIVGHPYRGL